MNKYELLIACRTEKESHRKDEGDIIDIKEAPWEWGKKEVCGFLVVPIQTKESLEELQSLLQPEREDGSLETEEKSLDIVWNLDGTIKDVLPVLNSSPIIKKTRFQIPLDILSAWSPDLDFEKVRNPKITYQPFKGKNISVDMDEKVAIIKDKVKGTFKYGKFKKTTA